MDSFFQNFFTYTPSWFFIIASIIILLGLASAAWWIVMGARRFAKSLGKESKLIELQKENYQLKSETEYHENVSSKLETVIENSRLFINSINDSRGEQLDFSSVIQRIIESLAADVKTKPGEKHRCGFWLPSDNEQSLVLVQGSSGFPDHYIGNRILEFNDSIAGRAFRKKELINCDDVNQDADYSSSNSNYKSLICVPINDFGVLTVDGLTPFDKNVESIAELYGSIIESVLIEVFISNVSSSEVAYTSNNIEEEIEDD